MITREQKRAKGAPTANPIYLADVLNEANAQKAGAGLNPEGNKALEKLKT
jgi:hypothetical protein